MVDLLEHPHDTSVVNTRDHDRKQVREQCWLLLEVERKRLVVAVPGGQQLFPLKESRTYISTFATRTMTSLNWLCSHASADRSIIASAALSNSSYLMYRNTSSGQRCARSAPLITYDIVTSVRYSLEENVRTYLGDVDARHKQLQVLHD